MAAPPRGVMVPGRRWTRQVAQLSPAAAAATAMANGWRLTASATVAIHPTAAAAPTVTPRQPMPSRFRFIGADHGGAPLRNDCGKRRGRTRGIGADAGDIGPDMSNLPRLSREQAESTGVCVAREPLRRLPVLCP